MRQWNSRGENMFGIGLPELIVIFIFLVPIIFIVYIIVRSERLIRNQQEELSSEIKQVIQRLSQF